MNPGSRIVSQTATATVTTSDGADIVDGGANSTIVGGHSQSDLVTYEGRSEPVRLDMTQPNTLGAPGENDTIIGVEDVMGGHADDVIVGDASQNLISGDPQPPVVNVAPDPPPPPGPPGGRFGNDHITTRDAGRDTVDCTGGTGDVHIADVATRASTARASCVRHPSPSRTRPRRPGPERGATSRTSAKARSSSRGRDAPGGSRSARTARSS